jgi:RNA polymerase sigma-70 factor (ECF subfamily)
MSAPSILFARLERAMATMDRRSREIFLAHRLEALSYEEIAAHTGLTTGEVEQHIARAIFHLDHELAAMESGEQS